MYTICPNCKSVLSFTLPVSKDQLPDGYKHRIKCPCCGKTLGVNVNPIKPAEEQQVVVQTPVAEVAQQPVADESQVVNSAVAEQSTVDASAQTVTEHQAVDDAPSEEQIVTDAPTENVDSAPIELVDEIVVQTKTKKSGVGRNVVLLLIALAFVAITVVGYVLAKSFGADLYGGLLMFKQIANKVALTDAASIVRYVLPFVLFVVAGVQVIVAAVSLGVKKYSRAFNLAASLIIAAISLVILLYPVDAASVGENVKAIISKQGYIAIVGAVLGVLEFVLSLCFLKSLERKEK